MDGITVLRCMGDARATKRWRKDPTNGSWTKASYQAGAWFTATEHKVSSLADLAKLVDGMRRDPAAMIVRGALCSNTRLMCQSQAGSDSQKNRCTFSVPGTKPADDDSCHQHVTS